MSFPVSSVRLALQYAREEVTNDPRIGIAGAVTFGCSRVENVRANASNLHDQVMREVDRARDLFLIDVALQLLPDEPSESKGD